MLRVYCSDWDDSPPILDPSEQHHLVRVRRVRPGEPVEILNGRGRVGLARIGATGRSDCRLELESTREVAPPKAPVHLLVALPKGKVFPAVLQKAVELGAAEITPLMTRNVEADAGRTADKETRWSAILVEALKQSGNPWLPVLHPPASLEEAMARTTGAQKLCAALQPDARPLWSLLGDGLVPTEPIAVFVGPEGDFCAEEYAALREAGARFASLGELVLKVETAASLTLGILRSWIAHEAC